VLCAGASEAVSPLLRVPTVSLLPHQCTLLVCHFPRLCLLLSSPHCNNKHWDLEEFIKLQLRWQADQSINKKKRRKSDGIIVFLPDWSECFWNLFFMCLCSLIWKLKREEAARINLELRIQELRLKESFNIPVATDFMAMFDSLAAKRITLGCKAQNKLCRKSATKWANFSLNLAPTIVIFLLVATPIVPNFGAADGFTASMLQYVHARWVD
jgi:hypothetical protein